MQAHPRRGRQPIGRLLASTGVVLVALAVLGWWSNAGPGDTGAGPSLAAIDPAGASPDVHTTAVAPSAPIAASIAAPSQAAPQPLGPGNADVLAPASPPPSTAAAPPVAGAGRFGLGLLIADRGNGRLLIVDQSKRILWRFPVAGSLPAGQSFSADDAFLAPDGRTIVANDETHQVIDRIDIASRKIVWQYGHYGRAGSATGYLHTPDDAYPLANGDVRVADIANCRILEVNRAHRIVHQWGRTGVCRHAPPASYASPNGDTPLPDGGVLVTEIHGSHVVRLDARGRVRFDVHVPAGYLSDAQLMPNGNVLVVDFSNPGAIIEVNPRGHVVWRYRPTSGPGRLDHPSLAIPLPDGTIAVNDDFRARVLVIDPRTNQIVWQYGHTGVASRRPGYVSDPDGINLIPLGTRLTATTGLAGGSSPRG